MKRLTKREGKHTVRIGNEWKRHDPIWDKLAAYEDTELTPEEFKESVDFILELNAKVHKVIKDLKYYLDTNEKNGVVYIPKFVIEKMVDEHLKTNF